MSSLRAQKIHSTANSEARMLTTGQIVVSMSTDEGGHRGAFSNELREAPHISRGLLSRPLSLKPSQRHSLFFVMPVNSLVVDSTLEKSEKISITSFFVVCSLYHSHKHIPTVLTGNTDMRRCYLNFL